ncbi:hypothetical protein ACXPWS_13600 [Mycobacterium sp. BMJ-28]
MAEFDPMKEMEDVQLMWNLPSGPAPLVNQLLLQPVPDADGGPGEIVVRLGYALPPPNPTPGESVSVTTVAAFTLTRHRAAQFRDFLDQQINYWDAMDTAARGEKPTP